MDGVNLILIRNIVLALILIVITYTDFKRQEIDHEPIIIGLAFSLLFGFAGYNNVSIYSSITGFLIGGILFTILAFWGMGGGDIKLISTIGFILGWKQIILVIEISFILGAIMGISYMLLQKAKLKEHIPFGPAIALATFIVMVYGNMIVNNLEFLWYLR